MPRRVFVLALLPALVIAAPRTGLAQETTEGASSPEAPPPAAAQASQQPENLRFGIGFQSSLPAWGLSAMYDINDQVTAQAIVGAFGTLTTFGGRGLYRFSKEEAYNLYGYGTVGMWSYPGIIRENVVGFGGGAGIELDWRRILGSDTGSFPPIFSSIDIGMVLASFEYYNFSGFTMGGGIHYRF
jgi:hypothetical protein